MLPYLDCPEQLWDVILVQEELHEKAVSLARLLPKDVLLCQVGSLALLPSFGNWYGIVEPQSSHELEQCNIN